MKNQHQFVFSLNDGNVYMQDIKNNLLLYLPPELHKCLNKENELTNEDNYYLRKYLFLKENLSSDYSMMKNYSGKLSSALIKKNVVNTNQITFEVTDACNLNCTYCSYGSMYSGYDKRENKYLSWNVAKSLLDYLAAYWRSESFPSVNKTIAIGFYGGEPLLNISLIKQIIAYLEELNLEKIKFHYVMTTNGVLLDKYMDYLVEKQVVVSVSLDGNEKNSAYRVTHNDKNSFSIVSNNVQLLKNRYPQFFETNVRFVSVLHNKNSMSDIYHFFHENFNKMSTVSEVSPVGVRNDKVVEFEKMYRNKNESLNTSENYSEMGDDLFLGVPDVHSALYYLHSYSGNVIRDYSFFFVDSEVNKWLPTGTCTPFSKRIFLTVNGKLLPCERIGQNHALGQVDENGVILDFDRISNKYNSYFDKMSKQCNSCFRLKGCLQCVFHIKNIDDNPLCNGFVNQKKFVDYLMQNISFLEKNCSLYNKIMEEVILE